MPPRRSETLTEAELRVMNVLWEKGPCTVQQLLQGIPEGLDLAYNSVLTTVRILENKGYVRHVKEGRAHIYEPIVAREDASRSAVRQVVSRFFGNSHQSLLLNLLEEQQVDPEEIKRLRELLKGSEQK